MRIGLSTYIVVQTYHSVVDLGFHEGGFIRSGALVCPQKFLQTTPTFDQKPRPFTLNNTLGVELGVCLRFILYSCMQFGSSIHR